MRAFSRFSFDTIYIGGGTPSLLAPERISDILQTAYQCFDITDHPEITIEINPGTADLEKLITYRGIGINRISIGVQSFQDKFLQFLGRIHSAEQGLFLVRSAQKAGFDNIGLDLIYGIPGQSESEWQDDLNAAVRLAPAHLSCYMLTYEKGTRLDRQRQAGMVIPADEETVGKLFSDTARYLTSCGYVHYEISNFAESESLMSRHNRKYWNMTPYFGFGPSAHSFIPPQRSWNLRSVGKYIQQIDRGKLPVESSETLSREEMMIEAVYLGLRQHQGIDIQQFDRTFGVSFKQNFGYQLEILEQKGLIEMTEKFCRLSEKGMRFADGIAAFLI